MTIVELIFLAIGLSMDAFTVSICKGLTMRRKSWKAALVVGLWFGIFQALMPTVGYFLAAAFEEKIQSFDHWVAFGLLCIIGFNMIREAFFKKENNADGSLAVGKMFVLAVATSIDALAVGITFALISDIHLGISVGIIGVITFFVCACGVYIGNIFGAKYKEKAQIFGGILLILLGFKIFFDGIQVF